MTRILKKNQAIRRVNSELKILQRGRDWKHVNVMNLKTATIDRP